MIVTLFSPRPNGNEMTAILRLSAAIGKIGPPLGFDGDPLAEHFPSPRTQGDLVHSHQLLQSLPAGLRNWDRRLAHQMCKAAVFGRTRSGEGSRPASRKQATAAKLERERKHARSGRAAK